MISPSVVTSVCAAALTAFGAASSSSAQMRDLQRQGTCARESATLFGTKPARLHRGLKAPKLVLYVSPEYPDVPDDTVGRGAWRGEVLVDPTGKVVRVWPIRKVTPPLRAFNQAIIDAVGQWQYEPLHVGAEAMPVCRTVSVHIHWQ